MERVKKLLKREKKKEKKVANYKQQNKISERRNRSNLKRKYI